MARRWVSVLILLFFCLHAWGQKNYDDLAGLYHPYQMGKGGFAKAPRGYKPFYISHIGRHGSRYPVSESYVGYGLVPLSKADSAGLLTPEGRRVLQEFRRLDSVSRGTYGLICALGADEQQAIARRMATRFPQVFRQKGRDSVACFSTHKQRAILSMTNFAAALAPYAPGLHFSFAAGEKYFDVLCREDRAAPGLKTGSRLADKALKERFDYQAFYDRLFTDVSLARKVCIKSDRVMTETCVTNGSVANYLGIPGIRTTMTSDEFAVAASVYGAKQYVQHCGSAEQGEWRMHIMDTLVLDFVRRADAAVAGGRVAADLRFSHDVGMMPFLSLIGLEGYHERLTFAQVLDGAWDPSVMMPMAANLQLVFYRGRKGDVLVRVLFDEADSSFPALGPGPFYPWDTLRDYLLSVI